MRVIPIALRKKTSKLRRIDKRALVDKEVGLRVKENPFSLVAKLECLNNEAHALDLVPEERLHARMRGFHFRYMMVDTTPTVKERGQALALYRGKALHLGLLAVVLDMCLIVYTVFLGKDSKKSYDGNEALRTNALLVVLLGFFSFCLLSRGLWPIWGFLTIPLLFTLLMASMVVFPSLKIGTSRPQSSVIRTD
ncbi:hypothetical protein HPP92_027805 [Vanilla planifolia]|uniref:Uncharacterized protein n=1 Tax=Vanilla planifolia TaxID=51239 RepID=A0A835PAD2_VANPL|nr:hypothetical protein HPP92_027805 [Vanilla planifolia]KAG0448577.1 hypothetical protein HPP92_027747 [Vanilla planifolia]